MRRPAWLHWSPPAAQSEITLVCAGQYGRFVLDDAYCAGYLLREMEIQAQRLGIGLRFTDASKAVRALTVAYPDARTAFRESASGQRLLEIGGEKDFEFCLQTNTSPVVPHMKWTRFDLVCRLGQLSIKIEGKMAKKEIIVAGILDTKGEIKFLAERVRAAGGSTTYWS